MTHAIETLFYTREKPWHGQGVMVQEAPTSADALHLAGLDWIVEPKPVFVESNGIFGTTMEPIPGFVANTRNTDGHVLGIVTNSYKIIQNVDAFAFTDNLISGDVHYETAGSLAQGKRVWLLAKLPETEIVGDKTEQYLVFTNTFDGSGSVKVACTPVRVVCQNTLNYALQSAKAQLEHPPHGKHQHETARSTAIASACKPVHDSASGRCRDPCDGASFLDGTEQTHCAVISDCGRCDTVGEQAQCRTPGIIPHSSQC